MSSPIRHNSPSIKYASRPSKDDDEVSVDNLLANIDQFIEGVYRDLSISPERRSLSGYTVNLSTGSSNLPSSTIASGSASATPVSTLRSERSRVKSQTSRRNMDAEIEKINQICNNVDQNLRSIGLFMNNSSSNRNSENLFNTDSGLTDSGQTDSGLLSSSASILILNQPNQPGSTKTRKSNSRNNPQGHRSLPIRQVVDLSDSQSETITQPVRHGNDYSNGDDDDVILVSADIPSVVDLCTPNERQEALRSRSPINYQILNRRRLTHSNDAEGLRREGILSTRKRNSTGKPPPYTPRESHKASGDKIGTEFNNASCTSSVTNSDGRTPFMCPVCMEPCLQRCPTSTLCGHVFCKECIEKAIVLTHKCPMCNRKISKKQTFRIYL